jgi:hypothetical protein
MKKAILIVSTLPDIKGKQFALVIASNNNRTTGKSVHACVNCLVDGLENNGFIVDVQHVYRKSVLAS